MGLMESGVNNDPNLGALNETERLINKSSNFDKIMVQDMR